MQTRRNLIKQTAAGIFAAALMAPGLLQAQESFTFSLADSLPTTHYTYDITQEWIKLLEKRSDGRIKIVHYPAGQVASAQDMLDAIQNRIADIAYLPVQYFAEKMPLATVGSLPIPELQPSVEALDRAYLEIGKGILDEAEMRDAGVRVVRASTTSYYNIHMKTKKIEKLEDLAGMKIRVGGNVQQTTVQALGGIPVTMVPPEMYNALQNGTLDGTVFSLPSVNSYKLDDLLKYSTNNLNLGVFATYFAMNRELWESLPEDIRTIFDEVGEEIIAHESSVVEGLSEEYISKFRDRGLDIYDLEPEVLAEITERLNPIREEWTQLYSDRGLPAQEVVDQWVALLKKHGGN